MIKRNPLTAEQEIEAALSDYTQLYPAAETKCYRYNSGCIRIRIVDPRFAQMSRIERNDEFWKHVEELSDNAYTQISMIVLVSPAEFETSAANLEFEHPSKSTL